MKAVIYLRTSTDDQHPELQKEDCIKLMKSLEIEEFDIFEEKQSAWKNDEKREIFNEIKKDIMKRKYNVIVVWDLDRLYRNRKRLVGFFELCKQVNCKIYSHRQKFLEDINNSPEPWNEMLFNNMVFILGWIAEEESNKKSERVRNAIESKDGVKYSKYGKEWGTHKLGNDVDNKIIELHKNKISIRKICKEVYYWDKNKNKRFVSLGYVHKTITKFNSENIV